MLSATVVIGALRVKLAFASASVSSSAPVIKLINVNIAFNSMFNSVSYSNCSSHNHHIWFTYIYSHMTAAAASHNCTCMSLTFMVWVTDFSVWHHFYAPNFEEVEGAYWFGPVHPIVHLSVRNTFWQLRNSRTPYARILKFLYGIYMKNKRTHIFFSSAGLVVLELCPFFDYV